MADQDRPIQLNRPTGPFGSVGLDRISQLAWGDVRRTDINQRIDPSTDPTHSHWIHKFHLGDSPNFLKGRIVDSIAYANCYKVQFDMWATMWCKAASPTALQVVGAKQISQLPVGAAVIVMWFRDDQEGIITGVIPDPQVDSQSINTDFISQQGRAGLHVDAAHHFPFSLPRSGLITDWSGGRPYDSTSIGEAGQITESGLLQFIDSFMAIKRVDEECGLWVFWHDQLTRLGGHNFQQWTAGSEREDKDDEGEFNKVESHTPYYWEALGALEIDVGIHRTIPPEDWQHNPELQGYNALEPCADDQLAFYRLRDFYGYLGQGHKRVLCLPPVSTESSEALTLIDDPFTSSSVPIEDCPTDSINTLSKQLTYPGVFEETLALSGRLAVRSAHEIIFSKHVVIPGPKQMILPEDPGGDSAENYHAAGRDDFGTGEEHKIQGEIDVVGDDDPTQIRSAGFLDTHAFVFNWVSDHPFHYHERDWYLPEERDLSYVAFEPIRFDDLQCYQNLQAPAAIPLKVDHRYGEVKYYPNHSYFGLLADGGIVLGCGFGSEIRLANGHIRLTAPGDISIEAGRDVVSLAGYDVIIRAKGSWDISATEKDGRLKAKEKLWMVASGDCGNVLIQSKAAGPGNGGILLKAEDSLLTFNADNICHKLTDVDDREHSFIFDAGEHGRVKFRTRYFERFLVNGGAAFDLWAAGDSVIQGAEYWIDGAIFSSPVVINNKLLVNDCIIARDNLVSTDGHVLTKLAKHAQGQVGSCLGCNFDKVFSQYEDRSSDGLPTIGDKELNELIMRQIDLCEDNDFTFRSVTDYLTQDFTMFESRWQQLARLSNSNVNIWTEEGIDNTYPYPGKENFTGATFRTLDPALYDVETGFAADRGAEYETPEFNMPVKKVLNNSYMVII